MDPATENADLARSRSETRAAFKNRAIIYAYLLDELKAEIGEERAIAVMKRAIHRRGVDVGAKYKEAAENRDLGAIADIFCGDSPCAGALFEPGVEELQEDTVVLRMTSCPLLDAWREAGLSEDDADTLCDVASAIDEGTFESAGLELTFLDRLGKPGSRSCLLRLRLRKAGHP